MPILEYLVFSVFSLMSKIATAQIIRHSSGRIYPAEQVVNQTKNYIYTTDASQRSVCALDPSSQTTQAGTHGKCLEQCAKTWPCIDYNYHLDTGICDLFNSVPTNFTYDSVCINYHSTDFCIVYPFGEPTLIPYNQLPFPNGPILIQWNDGLSNTAFSQLWTSYQQGFQFTGGYFWIGNDLLYSLTSTNKCKIHFDIQLTNGTWLWAEYSTFIVGAASTKYLLSASGFSGNAEDGLQWSNGKMFSTKDADNDVYSGSCSQDHSNSGWWFEACGGVYIGGTGSDFKWSGNGDFMLKLSRTWLICK